MNEVTRETLKKGPQPKLLLAKSTVEVCASCGAWYERYPTFLEYDGKGDQCDHCGCTSFKVREGRPYGPKSKDWDWICMQFAELWTYFEPEECEDVVTEPPLADLLRWKEREVSA